MKPAYIVTLLASLTMASQSNAAWQRLGNLEKHPVDLASTSISGVSVKTSNGVAQPENLLSDDAADSSKLVVGKSDVVYALGQQDSIDLVGLANDGAEGKVSVLTSADAQSWTNVAQSVFTSSDRNIQMRFAHASTGFIKLQFELSKAGAVRQLSIYGARTDADFESGDASVNAASGLSGARVIYCHPTPVGGDDFAVKYNRFDFPESDEKYRTLIYDLGKPSLLTEVGSVHSPRPVRFSAYAFDKLPEKEDWRHRMSFDPSVFDTAQPVATVEDSAGVGYTKAKLTKSVTARYLALRWEPDFNPPGFVVTAVNIPIGKGGPAQAHAANKPGAAGGAAGGGGAGGTAGGGAGGTGNAAGSGNFSSPFSISASSGLSNGSVAQNNPQSPSSASAPKTGGTVSAAPRPVKTKK